MPKVLLVDDEPAILESTRMLLVQMGYDVATASTADAILPALRQERPDLLLQDIRMPGLDLAALVREIRADGGIAHIPVLLFSASMEIEEIAHSVGAASHLEKPFRPQDLVSAIDGALS